MENALNGSLEECQNEWKDSVLMDFKAEYKTGAESANEGYKLSWPFYFRLPEVLEKRRSEGSGLIMVVGLEANNFYGLRYTDNERVEENDIEAIGKWVADYLLRQVYEDAENSEVGLKFNSSPFWKFFRELRAQTGMDICWNNLDKLHRLKPTENEENDSGKDKKYKTVPLTCRLEKALHKPLENGKTLLLCEINAVKPDAIVFFSPSYYKSISYAFQMDGELQKALYKKRPTQAEPLCDITAIAKKCGVSARVIWTYHPAAFAYIGKGKLGEAIKDISRMINGENGCE